MKIVYFAPAEFSDLKQRPQHIAEELSKTHDVWYVEPTISLLGAMKQKNKKNRSMYYDISPSLHVIRLDGTFALPVRMQNIDPCRINTWYERWQLKKKISDADLWWIGYETWGRLISRHSPQILYDKMDENVLLNSDINIQKFLKKMEQKILLKAETVLVTANQFYEDISKTRSNVFLIPNGVDFSCNTMTKHISNTKKVFGYIGKISHWFDKKAVEVIAKANPESEVVLVGPNDQPEIQCENVKYCGAVPKEEVPQWIQSFDVCLYPFKRNGLLDTINPVKIYEYLAMNKPVLAVESKETRHFQPYVHCYHTYEELKEMSKREYQTPFLTEEELQSYMDKNTWKCRVDEINKILNQLEETR